MAYHNPGSVGETLVMGLPVIDAMPGESTLGEPTEQQVKTWGLEAARFISSEAGLGTGQWRGVKPLGQGSFGIVGLWEMVNRSGEVVDVSFYSPRTEVAAYSFLG